MSRPDAAGGEQIIVPRAQEVHRLDNRVLIVGDHPDFLQPYALNVQPERDLRDVPVLRPAGQYLVADHDERGGPGARLCHGQSLSAPEPEGKVPSRKTVIPFL
jgi:hypothetical protein